VAVSRSVFNRNHGLPEPVEGKRKAFLSAAFSPAKRAAKKEGLRFVPFGKLRDPDDF